MRSSLIKFSQLVYYEMYVDIRAKTVKQENRGVESGDECNQKPSKSSRNIFSFRVCDLETTYRSQI